MNYVLKFLQPCAAVICLLSGSASLIAQENQVAQPLVEIQPQQKIVIIGNTLAERMNISNSFETLLHAHFPKHELVVRNLGWSADTITSRMRSQDFPDHGHTLIDHKPDVILAMFGFNESFAGPEGLAQFKTDLTTFLKDLKELKYPVQSYQRGTYQPQVQDKTGEVMKSPQVVLISPIANQDLPKRGIMAGTQNNKYIELYSKAMEEVAKEVAVPFVDLFNTSQEYMANANVELTINGSHLNESGYSVLAPYLVESIFGSDPKTDKQANDSLFPLQEAVAEKNKQFYYDYRAINGFYIYGGRKAPFGVVNFPAEFEKLRKMIAVRDQRIWDIAQNKDVSAEIDDSGTGDFAEIQTNFKNEVHLTPPEEALESFTLADGFKVGLWASEVDFPNLENPVQFTFDAKGRLFTTTMPSYPMYLPGVPVDDKVVIYEDSDGDGKADKETIFARGLHVPTGIELANGGAYIAQQPNLMFIKDTDGDDIADKYEQILHGFDSADSHHAISAFELGPGGELYFQEGTFHHSQTETPHGPVQVANAAVFRYEPKPDKLDVFVSYDFANPWGHCFDQWGQNFVADASGGANYVGAAFSGDLDHPRKHPGLKEFLVKQWRPTCGCEIVSSRNFPKEMQGDYLLNNCIGFQGVLQYRMKDEGSGYFADPIEPLLRSSDPNFRPVDLQFGPDGALYILDWFNPLVGHMQHNIRDPNRDKHHGRIWKVTYTKNELVKPAQIAGESNAQLLDLLKTYEDRTRFRARRELGSRDQAEVVSATDQWVSELDESEELFERNLLEATWVKQHHNVVDLELLNRVLSAKDGKVRAAGVRILCYQRDRIENTLEFLQAAVNDEFPRVRLEAIRALSFFDSQQALDIAVESLIYDQDVYLEYALKETMETLQQRIDAKAKQVSTN